GDAQEANPLEQRQGCIVGLREYAGVEIQEGQLPVDVELGSLEIHVEHERRHMRDAPRILRCARTCVTAPRGCYATEVPTVADPPLLGGGHRAGARRRAIELCEQ